MNFFVHLFTHKEVQMTLMTIGYKTIDNFNESCILQNGFSKVSNHIYFNPGILTKSSSLFLFIFYNPLTLKQVIPVS